MESMLIRERYKIVRILWSQPGYALAEAVDIQDRETPPLISGQKAASIHAL